MKVIPILACAVLTLFATGCSGAIPQPSAVATATSPTSKPLLSTPTAFPTIMPSPLPVAPTACPDPIAIIKVLYDSNDASQFVASLALFTDDATLST